MVKRKGKSISFDAMVKFFMQNYNIATKRDIDRLIAKVDRLEKLISSQQVVWGRSPLAGTSGKRSSLKRHPMSASDTVCDIIKRFKKGAGFSEIQARTGYDDKKLRNIIFRLDKLGRITRKARGIYIAT
ncbi:MAG: hypothetical protein V3S89_06545 [Desulfobacterales bacterium]